MVSSGEQNPNRTVTMVSASWIVPTVNASTSSTYSAIWIGIGGAGNDTTLIQCGTEQDSIIGTTIYYAWYELLPGNSIRIGAVSAGDEIQATIQLANLTTNQWAINITDVTNAETFQRTFTYNSSQLTADWIIERPTLESFGHSQFSPLADFETATFTNCTATIGLDTGYISSFYPQVFTMSSTSTSGAVELTDVSDLASDGSSFTVTWLAAG